MKQRPAKPLFLIDASVPRNIDEDVSTIDNVFLYNMDDVSSIANENLKFRMEEVNRCRNVLGKRALRIWEQMTNQTQSASADNQSTTPSS